MPDLATPEDLADFSGAPFSETLVRSAGASLRNECGWHIAPEVTETVVVDSDGGTVLPLPSLRVVEVTSVRDVTGEAPRILTGWRLSPAGLLYLGGGWPRGYSAVEVTLTHGYDTCPPELLGLIAERSQRRGNPLVSSESIGGRSVTLRDPMASVSPVLARYRLTGMP